MIDSDRQALLVVPGLYERLGIPPELVGFFRELAQYADGSVIIFRDFQHQCTRVVGISTPSPRMSATATMTNGDCSCTYRPTMTGEVPKRIDFRGEMPLSSFGKILRRDVRKSYWQQQEVQV